MQHLEVSCAVQHIYTSLGAKWLNGIKWCIEVETQPVVFGIGDSFTFWPQVWTDCSLLLCFLKWRVMGGSLKRAVVILIDGTNLHPLYTFRVWCVGARVTQQLCPSTNHNSQYMPCASDLDLRIPVVLVLRRNLHAHVTTYFPRLFDSKYCECLLP